MGLLRNLGRRWNAHEDNVKEKRWEYAADHGEPGFDLEDIGEHVDPPEETPAASAGIWGGFSGVFGFFSGWGGWGGFGGR